MLNSNGQVIQFLRASDTLFYSFGKMTQSWLRAIDTIPQSLRANDTNCFGQMRSGQVRHDRINTLASKGPYFNCPHGGLPKVNCLARRIVSVARRDSVICPKQSVSFARLSINCIKNRTKNMELRHSSVLSKKTYICITSVFSKLVSFFTDNIYFKEIDV